MPVFLYQTTPPDEAELKQLAWGATLRPSAPAFGGNILANATGWAPGWTHAAVVERYRWSHPPEARLVVFAPAPPRPQHDLRVHGLGGWCVLCGATGSPHQRLPDVCPSPRAAALPRAYEAGTWLSAVLCRWASERGGWECPGCGGHVGLGEGEDLGEALKDPKCGRCR